MKRTSGRPEIRIGLIDGPVAMNHPELASENIREIPGTPAGTCARASSAACQHGTFVAGILAAKRGSVAPAICPDCTLLLRPIFSETTAGNGPMPSATPEELAMAVFDTIAAGARLLNLSAALAQPSMRGERQLEEALGHAVRRGVIVVAAAGNQATVGSSAITRHPWVIPVIACDPQGWPTPESNLSASVGRRGLAAPGEGITSLGAEGRPHAFGGSSAATPFVTGALALLWSEFPAASATTVKLAVSQAHTSRPSSVVPPLLDAWRAYQTIANARG
jgi:subtilisin family serine protease